MRPVLVLAVAIALCSPSVSATNAELLLQVKALAPGPASGTYRLWVLGDVDGDGMADERILTVQCDGTRLQGATLRPAPKSPRDAASGMASGKSAYVRGGAGGGADSSTVQWPLLTVHAEALLPRLRIGSVPYAARAGSTPVDLAEPATVCPALQQAANAVINTSRSNVKS